MVAFPIRQRLILPIASTGGGIAATLVGIAMLVMPAHILESAVMASGLPAVLAAAEPPLGLTARTGLAFLGALILGGGLWAALHGVFGTRALAIPLQIKRTPRAARVAEPAPPVEGAPIVRRADAHPDAPPRRPLMAREELGTPFLEVRADTKAPSAPKPAPRPPVERALPRDLDAPLADFDPDALPDVPAEPVRPVPSLARKPEPVQAPGERFETYELRPPVPSADAPVAPRAEATIHALLDRLERGVAGRTPPSAPVARPEPAPTPSPAKRSLQDTLAELRQLAARAS